MWAVSSYKFLSVTHKLPHFVNKQFSVGWIMWLNYKRKLLQICSLLIYDIKHIISVTRVQWFAWSQSELWMYRFNRNRTSLKYFIVRRSKRFFTDVIQFYFLNKKLMYLFCLLSTMTVAALKCLYMYHLINPVKSRQRITIS